MKLTITGKDLAEASHYFDSENCLLATMLKRRGHKSVLVLGWYAHAGDKEFEIVNHSDIPDKLYVATGKRVRKSAIGKKIELVEV